jgi:hypothetical protein
MTSDCWWASAADNGFYNNTVSSVIKAGYSFRMGKEGGCQVIRNHKAYHCGRGIMGTLNVNEIRIEDIIMAENTISVTLKTGTLNDYNNGYQ